MGGVMKTKTILTNGKSFTAYLDLNGKEIEMTGSMSITMDRHEDFEVEILDYEISSDVPFHISDIDFCQIERAIEKNSNFQMTAIDYIEQGGLF